mgnify:CR=1 FL=1
MKHEKIIIECYRNQIENCTNCSCVLMENLVAYSDIISVLWVILQEILIFINSLKYLCLILAIECLLSYKLLLLSINDPHFSRNHPSISMNVNRWFYFHLHWTIYLWGRNILCFIILFSLIDFLQIIYRILYLNFESNNWFRPRFIFLKRIWMEK